MHRIGDYQFQLHGQKLTLTPEKAIYWEDQSALILSDLHLGKSGHFRKHGVPVPDSINSENLIRLDTLIRDFKVDQILFLGDLFHSDKNIEWEMFSEWRKKNEPIKMILAIGNHDFHSIEDYEHLGLACSDSIVATPFLFLHDATQIKNGEDFYTITGHIHPSVKLKGKARQSTRLPCFLFSDKNGLLPAFGSFTGTHTVKPSVNDKVFAVLKDEIIPVQ